jgi:ThiF family
MDGSGILKKVAMEQIKLRLNEKSYETLKPHLFSGDGRESIAFGLCGKFESSQEEFYTVHRVELYPNEKCPVREFDKVQWSPPDIVHLFEECRQKNFVLIKIHCHPGALPEFSSIDDESDTALAETVAGWTGRSDKLLSMVMLPDGKLFGRAIDEHGRFLKLESILVVGDNILRYSHSSVTSKINANVTLGDEIQLRTMQAFGEGTVEKLRELRIGVVGCSGTGSVVAELLGRLGVGQIVLVDPDIVERKNLNRILNATVEHAVKESAKVIVLKEAIEKFGTGCKVTAVQRNLYSTEAFSEIKACDIVFGCMDSVDGRHLLNRISTYYCMAYFDLGIRLDADGSGGINSIVGRVDYLQPGGSSLLSRQRYTVEQLRAADLARTSPDEYKRQLSEKYIKSANVDSPAVISVNMMISSQAVTELLARLHPFRTSANSKFAALEYSIDEGFLIPRKDGEPDQELMKKVGLGDVNPLLGSPMLNMEQI